MRWLVLLALAALAWRWALGRWPWEAFAGSPRRQALDRARKLLGVPAGASRDEIIAAHRRLVAMVHPDRGGTSEQVNEANAARDLLLGTLPDES
mgnify:CR=1 FL=1